MSWLRRWTRRAEEPQEESFLEMEAQDAVLRQALGEFRDSVHAWSDAEWMRQRRLHATVAHRAWRLAAGWALAAVLLAGTTSGGVYAYHRHALAVQAAQAREAERQRAIAAEQARHRAQQEEELLASVDSAVSRTVPSALEPLADLVDESGVGD